MIKGAQSIGALPRTSEHPSWLPVDYAGRAIKEIVLSSLVKGAKVYHIVNPNDGASWDDLLAALHAAGLNFQVVDVDAWLNLLERSEQDPNINPVIKLQVRHRVAAAIDYTRGC
jgi:hypothetical protein